MDWQPPAVSSKATWTRTFGPDDAEAFARTPGDRNTLHLDPSFARPVERLEPHVSCTNDRIAGRRLTLTAAGWIMPGA